MTITFTIAQEDSFFTNGPQMVLSAAVCARLSLEGLAMVADFSDFKEDQLTDAFKNMRTSIPGVPGVQECRDPANNAIIVVHTVPAVPPGPPTLVSAKYGLRPKIAFAAFHYYDSMGRNINAPNMN